MSKTLQFVNELLANVDFCAGRAEEMIFCFKQTGDPDFLDLAEDFSTLANQYNAEAEALLNFIRLTQAGFSK